MKPRKKLFAKKALEPTAVPRASVTEAITRFWVTLFIIFAILYIAALLISRTEGFRGVVRQQLESMTGLQLVIDRVHAKPNLDLVMEGLREVATNKTYAASIEVKKVEMAWRIMPLIRGSGWPFGRLHLQDGTVNFSQRKDGTWAPLPALHGMLAPWLEIPSIPVADAGNAGGVTDWMRRENIDVSLTNINLIWHAAVDGEPPVISIEGLSLRTAPVQPFSNPVMWFEMAIQRAASRGVVWARQLKMEWIRLSDQDVVLRYKQTEEP